MKRATGGSGSEQESRGLTPGRRDAIPNLPRGARAGGGHFPDGFELGRVTDADGSFRIQYGDCGVGVR